MLVLGLCCIPLSWRGRLCRSDRRSPAGLLGGKTAYSPAFYNTESYRRILIGLGAATLPAASVPSGGFCIAPP
jgi:hypothetical protein